MKIIISDTGPILSLACINRIDILFKIYPDFFIPEAVFAELKTYLPRYVNDYEIVLKKLEPHMLTLSSHAKETNECFGAGEIECFILALESGINHLLIDDAAARKFAENMGLQCIGTLALIIKAKQLNLITEIRPFFKILHYSDRFFQIDLMNSLLIRQGEELI